MNKISRFLILIAVLCGGGVTAQITPTVPAPNRNITGPSPHRPPGDHPESTAGKIEGFVYWDVQKVSHVPANSCSGMAITVGVGSSSGGPLTAYTPLGTLSNNFKYAGQVKEFLAGGKINAYDVCTYAYDKVPVGPSLQVRLTVTQATAFSPGTTPQFEILGPITIVNGRCNMLPRTSNPTFSDLGAHWGTCQNMAYDVNFTMLHQRVLTLSSDAGGPAGSGTARVNANSGSPLLKDAGPAGTPMLSRAPQQGMLARGTGTATQSPSANGGLQQSRAQVSPVNPPLPPGSKAAPANRNALKPIKLAPPKALRKMTNPRLAEQNAGIIALLQQQRLAAQQEAAAMKLGVRSVASASVRAPVATTFQGNTTVQNLGPETTQSEKGALASRIVHAPVFNSIVLTCTNDPTPRIIQLSGAEGHGILTPEAKYNLYTITGCAFGPSDPGNSAFIFGVNGFKANLNIDFWSENGITAHLDPWLAGVLDQDNVTLVVAPAGKQPFNKSGYKFYAARGMPAPDGTDQETQLAYDSMPQARIALSSVSKFMAGVDQLPTNATSRFPSFSFQGTPVMGWVFRYAYGHKDLVLPAADCFINDMAYNDDNFCVQTVETTAPWTPEPDTWDLGKLAPGFAVSSYELFYEDTDPKDLCSAWEGEHYPHVVGSAWDSSFSQNQIAVTWLAYQCFEEENEGVNYRDETTIQSSYGLAVWVLGPRCVDPWTGQKDQACMNKVKQMVS